MMDGCGFADGWMAARHANENSQCYENLWPDPHLSA